MPGLIEQQLTTTDIADNTVLLAENLELQNLVTQINTKSQEYRVEITSAKAKIMVFSQEEQKPAVSINTCVNGDT